MRKIWELNKKWLIVLGALLAVALVACVVRATVPEQKTLAEPPIESEVTFDLDSNVVYSAEDGVIVIPAGSIPAEDVPRAERPATQPVASSVIVDSPEQMQDIAVPLSSGNYTLPEAAQMADGSIGVLSIPTLGLTVSVYESNDEMEAMTHGLAHFKTTSAWDGNTGLCGHNVNFDLTDGHFKRLYTLSEGDAVTYKTAQGSRSYTVTTVKEIAADDWSYLGRTEDNRITMITCISGQPDKRLVVQAIAAA